MTTDEKKAEKHTKQNDDQVSGCMIVMTGFEIIKKVNRGNDEGQGVDQDKKVSLVQVIGNGGGHKEDQHQLTDVNNGLVSTAVKVFDVGLFG